MSRETASTRLRSAASVALALLAWMGAGGTSVQGQESLSDRLTKCGNAVYCEDGGCVGSGGYCGNLVTPAGGCASGMEMFWFRGDYMLWQRDAVNLPPLVTSSPLGTPTADIGVLGEDSTTVVAGGQAVSDHVRSGYMLEFGTWLNAATGWAIVVDYFYGGRDSYGFTGAPGDEEFFARPFFDTQQGDQNALIVAGPNQAEGTVSVSAFDDFQSAGAAMQKCIWAEGNGCTSAGASRLTVLGGYRYYHQDSLVFVGEDSTALAGNTLDRDPGERRLTQDKFAGRNEFHGFEIGLQGRVQRCRWWCDGLAAVALGGSRRVVFVEGGTLVIDNGVGTISDGGVLVAAGKNFGRYTDDHAAAVPRFRLGGGWQATERMSIQLGYNLILWNGVVQAADHLPPNLEVDPRNLPGGMGVGGDAPVFPGLRDTTMVAHGLDLGLELWF